MLVVSQPSAERRWKCDPSCTEKKTGGILEGYKDSNSRDSLVYSNKVSKGEETKEAVGGHS